MYLNLCRNYVRPIHHRMPVILPLGNKRSWLPPTLSGMFVIPPFLAELMTAYPVTTKINRPSFNEPAAIAPLARVIH